MKRTDWIWILILAVLILVGALSISGMAQVPRNQEQVIAEAYHCGVLDAVQEKRGRGRACDEYKAIARKRGVAVPP